MTAAIALVAAGHPSDGLAQGKSRIAVTAFENKSKTPIPDSSGKSVRDSPRS
jgi:hypothetical protein